MSHSMQVQNPIIKEITFSTPIRIAIEPLKTSNLKQKN
jgi:hypothetical protein